MQQTIRAVNNAEKNSTILFGVFVCQLTYLSIFRKCSGKKRKDEKDGTIRAVG
jgi:hypothetical protein